MEEENANNTPTQLHAHRLDHNPSKLPAFRFADLKKPSDNSDRLPLSVHIGVSAAPAEDVQTQSAFASSTASKQGTDAHTSAGYFANHTPATQITNDTSSPATSSRPRTRTFPGSPTTLPLHEFDTESKTFVGRPPSDHALASPAIRSQHDRRVKRAPASYSSNGIETNTGPPPASSTQRSLAGGSARSPKTSTSEWALAQQQLALQSSAEKAENTTQGIVPPPETRLVDEKRHSRPVIPPIRSFRASTARTSVDMSSRQSSRFENQDEYYDGERYGQEDQESPEQRDNTITEDLFLNLARDDMSRQTGNNEEDTRNSGRRSRIAFASNRKSLPPGSSVFQASPAPKLLRRGSDAPNSIRGPPPVSLQQDRIYQRPLSRDRPIPGTGFLLNDSTKSRYAPRSNPTTPRSAGLPGNREQVSESRMSSSRRGSIPESSDSQHQRTPSYRQPNLSHISGRMYNSSPLVARYMESDDGPETPRAAEGTESTNSTTAPSTVWDELDELKSRMRKLELTAKLPATSGAAITHATTERPPTATTTATTMSTSPKRGQDRSASPTESTIAGPFTAETHPLLQSALAKTRFLLPSEVYKALEATTADALSVAAMTSSAGQPGPNSSAQSVIGTVTNVSSDRQLRRKVDGMCRSLTELCLTLSEIQTEQPPVAIHAVPRPSSRDTEAQNEQRAATANENLARIKASPRALSRLEARRSSLLANTSLPSPRFAPSEVGTTPTPSAIGGRRASVLLRSRRAGTEGLDETDESVFRAPSRAATEIGRGSSTFTTRASPRDYVSQQQRMEQNQQAVDLNSRAPSVQSSLPLRRSYLATNISNAVGNSGVPASPTVGTRRYLDRSTPERDPGSTINRLAEERSGRMGYENPVLAASRIARTGSLSLAHTRRISSEFGGYH